MENGRKWDPSGKNLFDFALKWDYNVEKYWFCREKQRIRGMVENLGLCPLFPKGRHRETKKQIEYKRV